MMDLLPISLRPNSWFSSSSSENSSNLIKHFLHRLLLLLVLLPLSVFLAAFFLQRQGGGMVLTTLDQQQALLSGYRPPAQVNSSVSIDRVTNGMGSLPISPDFRNLKHIYNNSHVEPKICITSTTSADLDQVLAWVFYHKVLGVTNFFLFVEGKAAIPRVSQVLETIPGLQVIHRTRELEEIQAKSPIWNDTGMSVFFNKPCNNELFVKQSLNMETAVVMAREAGMEWILHLDTDELLHPAGTTEYSIRELLTKVPKDVDMVVFPNYESAVERDNVREPFYEVSLFKKNFDHLTTYLNSELMTEANRGNPYYFLTYSNGKAAARLQDQLYPAGAHRWHIETKTPKEISMNETAVLHFTYSRFSDLTTRRNRCSCKPIKEGLERCIFLEFDRNAFIIASTATKEEMLRWYQEHVVWNDETLKLNLLKSGVLTRIYTPMVILRGLRQSGIFTSVIASAQTGSSRAELSKTGNNTTVGK